MPLITPPPDNEEPIKEPTKVDTTPLSPEREAHFKAFFAAMPKVCPSCGLTNHGWNKKCYCGRIW
jgi:hypothetical protein